MAHPPGPVATADAGDAVVGGEAGRFVQDQEAQGAGGRKGAQGVRIGAVRTVPSPRAVAWIRRGGSGWWASGQQQTALMWRPSAETVLICASSWPGTWASRWRSWSSDCRPVPPTWQPCTFYEDQVGHGHLLELAAWHLESVNYIADTLRLQERFARGVVLDFGGGIGTHALAAAALEGVDRVWYVDLNPRNRDFVASRARTLGLEDRLHCVRDLSDPALPARFDTIICLDVLEHLPDPAAQLEIFAARMNHEAVALFNWYFFQGFAKEYPFHLDDPALVDALFRLLQSRFLEVFHPHLITTRAYRLAS